MCKCAVAIFKFWISTSFLSQQDDLCHILFLPREEQLLLCHQLEMDGGPCVWLLPGRGAQQGWEEGGTQLFADCLTQPEAVVDFPSCVQNCQQSQLRGAEFALGKKKKKHHPASASSVTAITKQILEGWIQKATLVAPQLRMPSAADSPDSHRPGENPPVG